MSSFAKYVTALCVGLLVATVSPASAADSTPSKKKPKAPKADETPAPRKETEIPVIKDHPARGLLVPYFSSDGKRQMNFRIAVATRTADTVVNLENMQIETFDEHEVHEMDIDMPNSDLNTKTNIVTTRHHVKIDRDDFQLTGDAMVFNTVTKQGGLSGNVHMIIYDMKSKTGRSDDDLNAAAGAAGGAATGAKTPAAKTPEPKKN